VKKADGERKTRKDKPTKAAGKGADADRFVERRCCHRHSPNHALTATTINCPQVTLAVEVSGGNRQKGEESEGRRRW